jgi:hypothetical protein
MLIVMELLNIGLVLAHQLDGQRKRAGRVCVVIKVYLSMNGTSFQNVGLQRDFNRNRLFLFHEFLSFAMSRLHDRGSAYSIFFGRRMAYYAQRAAPRRRLRGGIGRIVRR